MFLMYGTSEVLMIRVRLLVMNASTETAREPELARCCALKRDMCCSPAAASYSRPYLTFLHTPQTRCDAEAKLAAGRVDPAQCSE